MEGTSPLERGTALIIGGGIAGLAAAFYLNKKAPQARIVLLEAGERWGGKITTERIPLDGGEFIIEGGPDTFLATKPYAVDLCREIGLEARLHGTNPDTRETFVLHNGHLLPLPEGLAMMIPSDVKSVLRSELLSWPAKLRMGLDFVLPAHRLNGDESLGTFVSRRLGRSAYENLIEPLMSGIYAGNGDHLSLASTFPYLRELELNYGSIARGALAVRKRLGSGGAKVQGSRSAFLTPRRGLTEIIETLVPRLKIDGVEMRLHTRVRRLFPWGSGYMAELADGSHIEADAIVLATPAPISSVLLSPIDLELSAALGEIPYSSTATISLAYRQSDLPRPLNGYGYVIPQREGRRALACTWTSSKFPHRAPAGYALIRVFVGRAEEDLPWTEAELLTIAKGELGQTLGIRAQPLVERVYRWERAMPQYNLGHPRILSRIDAALKRLPGLALAGNGYRGIGIPDCIHSGDLASDAAIQHMPLRMGVTSALVKS